MKRLLFDANVILDVLLDRRPHVTGSAAAWAAVESGIAEGLLAAHALTTIHSLFRKQSGAKTTAIVHSILRVFRVAAVDGAVIDEAMQLSCPDFEDAVTAASARMAGCDCIVTRDPKGFRGSPVRCLTPDMAAAFLHMR